MKYHKNIKVLVAMSGGVDSSLAAQLLIKAGYNVTGVFLKFWHAHDLADENICCSLKAYEDAKKVCHQLNIPLYTFNFKEPFKKEVVNNFIKEYKTGRTPSPCIICNKKVKLGLLIKKARALGFTYVATGHYAKIKKNAGQFTLWRGKDKQKDQSYFLYRLSQTELSHLLFPLANLTKNQVRALAQKYHLPTASKKESQEVCFVGANGIKNFLNHFLSLKPGSIKDLSHKILGTHSGTPLFTIGQRRGLNIGGAGPYYVVKIDTKKNILWVSNDISDLQQKKILLKNVTWINNKIPSLPLKCQLQIRYRQKPIAGTIFKTEKKYQITFTRPATAVTPGQSAVFYLKNQILGGGVIK